MKNSLHEPSNSQNEWSDHQLQIKTFIVLGLGTNCGKREQNLFRAYEYLKDILVDIKSSGIYESEPLYYQSQPRFLNMVLGGCTGLSPLELLAEINRIESLLGRDRENSIKNGPRTIDIDILLYGESVINSENLKIPHKMMEEREFVLKPLTEIIPGCINPLSGLSYAAILKNIKPQGVIYYAAWETILNQYK